MCPDTRTVACLYLPSKPEHSPGECPLPGVIPRKVPCDLLPPCSPPCSTAGSVPVLEGCEGCAARPPCAISIAPGVRTERAGSFNHGMKLTPGRPDQACLSDCSLPFAVERSIVAPLPGAAYP